MNAVHPIEEDASEPSSATSPYDGLITLCGRQLQLLRAPERMIRKISQDTGVPDPIAEALAKRGHSSESANAFMNMSLRTQLPDPFSFLDMRKAVERMVRAIRQKEQIAIFGDYDADGATSSALLARYLNSIGHAARIYIPDRFTEGYGPNVPAMLRLREEGASLCITVDCGTAAHAPLEAAQKAGLDVVVIDHHSPKAGLPAAHAIVNPKRLDETSPHTMLAAVGMTFLFVVGINSALRQDGFFTTAKPEPNLKHLLPLVAVGSVTDCVPLLGATRLLVHYGLKEMNDTASPEMAGIAALRSVCHLSRSELALKGRTLSAQDIAFYLGPRLNAAGRIDRSRTSAELLTMDDIARAQEQAQATDALNRERQSIEKDILAEALPAAFEQIEQGAPIIVVANEAWNPGVIGVAAGRLKERFERPVIVIGSHDGAWKGSGRSLKGIDLGAAVIAAEAAGLLVHGGGHAMAAGLTIRPEQIGPFRSFMAERIAPQLSNLPPKPIYQIDAVIGAVTLTNDFIDQQNTLGPFGQENPELLYLMPNARIKSARRVGEIHIQCSIARPDGSLLKAIAFRSAEEAHGQALLAGGEQLLHLVGTVDHDCYNGRRTPQFKVLDAIRI